MDLGHALVKAVLQGLTEFLPVSSTAHLIFTDALFHQWGWVEHTVPGEAEFYDIVLHIGTLGAVVTYYRAELLTLWQQCTQGPQANVVAPLDPKGGFPLNRALVGWVALTTAITMGLVLLVIKLSGYAMHQWPSVQGFLGLTTPESWYGATGPIEDISDYLLQHPRFVAFHLIGTGILLQVTDWVSKRAGAPSTEPATPQLIGPKQAIMVGVFQAWSAIMHGFSRSGSTMTGAVLAGLSRMAAARYAFLISIPIFIAVTIYELMKALRLGNLADFSWGIMAVGAVVSGIVGYWCVKGFVQYVGKHNFLGFSLYCWVIAGLMLWMLK